MKKYERIFNNDTKIKNKIVNKTFLGFKRNKNCKDLLVHRKHNKTFYKSKPGTVSCGKNCAICPYIIKNDVFIDKEGHKFYTKGIIKCDANNLIYGIYCEKMQKYNLCRGNNEHTLSAAPVEPVKNTNWSQPGTRVSPFQERKPLDKRLQNHRN